MIAYNKNVFNKYIGFLNLKHTHRRFYIRKKYFILVYCLFKLRDMLLMNSILKNLIMFELIIKILSAAFYQIKHIYL